MESGVAAGVPYVASPPASGRSDAPVVVGWHLLDSPRTEQACSPCCPSCSLTRPAVRAWVGAVKPYRAPSRRRPVPS